MNFSSEHPMSMSQSTSSTSDAAAIPQHQTHVPIASSRFLPGYGVSGRQPRDIFKGRGTVPSPTARTYREFKRGRTKKGQKETTVQPPAYNNQYFSEWQLRAAKLIHQGSNLILDVATSCGKTKAATEIVAYEILSRTATDGSHPTALIVSPNSEVMRDTVTDIYRNHNIFYTHPGTRMLDTITRNYATYDEKRGSTAQILVIAAECLEEFVTDPVNAKFIGHLQFIVLDEVHLEMVTRGLWWSQYIPHTAQLILLSATLGDPDAVKQTVVRIQELQQDRPRDTHIITYNVRPIPLQPLLYKGSDAPAAGVVSANLKGAGRLSCVINQFDPTVRDIQSLVGRDAAIPESREEQYYLGQQVVRDHDSTVREKLEVALAEAVTETTATNIYNLLSYLFSNDKQPVMVFNTTAGATENQVQRLVSHIAQLEQTDPEFRAAEKQLETYQKAHHRARDGDKKNKAQQRDANDWGKAIPEEDDSKINIHQVTKTINKWRFPKLADLDVPTNVSQWIKDALEYGIGVYVSTMKVWQRHYMFDLFREGKIQLLFSDSTISVGINLPIRTVVMCGYMSHTLYKQASGRAGRRGMDNQGYIVHMMPSADIRRCLTMKVPEVHLNMPKKMSHADLLRLLVPENLINYYQGDPKEQLEHAQPIAEYSRQIMGNYLRALNDDDRARAVSQMEQLQQEQWHYHRLTNMVKTLPVDTSIILVKLMAMGLLNDFENGDFFHLMALLFNRVEAASLDGVAPPAYYVPQISKIPDLIPKVNKMAKVYGIDVDFSRPIHRYFFDFCRNQKLDVDYLSQIEAMGEWLYIFKRGVLAIAPRKKKDVYTDNLANLVILADELYLAARAKNAV